MKRFRPGRQEALRIFLTLVAAALLSRAVPAAPPPQAAAAGRYVVQVGAYPGPRSAAPLAGELIRKGFPALVVPGADYHRVVVGPFANEQEAAGALSRLQQQGYQGYVRADLPVPSTARVDRPAPTRTAPTARPAETRPVETRPVETRPVEAPQPAPAPPRPSATERPFVVQVGAFDGLQTAAPLASGLLQRGFPAVVLPGNDYARVVVGPYASESEASAVLSGLLQQGYQGYVRSDLQLAGASETVVQSARPSEAQPAPVPALVTGPPPITEAAPVTAPAPETQPPQPPRLAEATPPPEPAPPLPTAPAQPTPAPTVPREADVPVAPAAPQQQPQPVEAAVTTLPEPAPAAPEPATAPIPEPTAAPEPAPDTPAAIPQAAAPAAPVSEPQQQGLAALFPPEPQPRARTGVVGLKLLVLAGQDAINNIKQRTARDPVVQVVDENDRPVAGAAITFALPSRGASGVFANGARSMTILTDAQGTAAASGLTPNAVAGELPIQVSASYQGQTASAVITQTNAVAAGAGMSAATIGIIGAVVAGAAVGAALALSGGDSTAAPAARPNGTATVRTGGVTIGAPAP